MPQRDHRTRKHTTKKSYPRFSKEIPWLTIILTPEFNLEQAVACWLSSRFLKDKHQGHTIRTSQTTTLQSIYEDPYWTQLAIGIGENNEFNPDSPKDGYVSEVVLSHIIGAQKPYKINENALKEIVIYSKGDDVLEHVLRGTRINLNRMEEHDEISAQKTLIRFGYMLDAMYQSLIEE